MRYVYLVLMISLLSRGVYGSESSLSLKLQMPDRQILKARFDAIGVLSFAKESGLLDYVAGKKMDLNIVYEYVTARMRTTVIAMRSQDEKSSAMLYGALEVKKPYILEALFQDTTAALLALKRAGHYVPTGKVPLPSVAT